MTRQCTESRRRADTEFQYRPRIVDTDPVFADPVFADPVSETPKQRAPVWGDLYILAQNVFEAEFSL